MALICRSDQGFIPAFHDELSAKSTAVVEPGEFCQKRQWNLAGLGIVLGILILDSKFDFHNNSPFPLRESMYKKSANRMLFYGTRFALDLVVIRFRTGFSRCIVQG